MKTNNIISITNKADRAALVIFTRGWMQSQDEADLNLFERYVAQGLDTWALAQPVVLEAASKQYNVPLVVSKSNNNKGALVLDGKARGFAAAAQRMTRAKQAFAEPGAAVKKAASMDPKAKLASAIKKADLTYSQALSVLNKVYGK